MTAQNTEEKDNELVFKCELITYREHRKERGNIKIAGSMCRLPVLLPSSQPSNWPQITSLGLYNSSLSFVLQQFPVHNVVSCQCALLSHQPPLIRLSLNSAFKAQFSCSLQKVIVLYPVSQPSNSWVILPSRAHLGIPGDIYDCHNRGCPILAFSGQKPGLLLYTLQCRSSPAQRSYLVQTLTVMRLRAPP